MKTTIKIISMTTLLGVMAGILLYFLVSIIFWHIQPLNSLFVLMRIAGCVFFVIGIFLSFDDKLVESIEKKDKK